MTSPAPRPGHNPGQLARAALLAAAWMLGAGSRWQTNNWIDLGDWLLFDCFIAGTPVREPAEHATISDGIAAACWRADDHGWTAMEGLRPHAILPAGHKILNLRAAEAAAMAERLSWLATRLPTTNARRLAVWRQLGERWLETEAVHGHRLTAAGLARVTLASKPPWRLAPDHCSAIIANLERLRSEAKHRFDAGQGGSACPAP